MSKKAILIIVVVLVALVFLYWVSPAFRAFLNIQHYNVQKADDATNYNTLKQVEDTCRSMLASYESDRLIYEQYKGMKSPKCDWAEQARMRANKTASTYNNYILQNRFIWRDNIPPDIRMELPYIQ